MVRCNTAIVLILVLISPTLSGCLGPVSENGDVEQYEHWLPPVEERSGKEYRNDDVFSRVSINGTYDTGDVQSIFHNHRTRNRILCVKGQLYQQ